MDKDFLQVVLGAQGLSALNRAIDRMPELRSVIIPRTLVSWINTVGSVGYEGELPGKKDSYFSLVKSENGYTGALTISNKLYTFNNQDPFHVAASVGVALDMEFVEIDEKLEKHNLTNLGKSIDLLVKSSFINKVQSELAKSNTYGDFSVERKAGKYLVKHIPSDKTIFGNIADLAKAKSIANWCLGRKEDILVKAAPQFGHHGPPAKHNKAFEATPALKPSLQTGYSPTGEPHQEPAVAEGQGHKLKLTKQELEKVCTDCGEAIFEDKDFKGCLCLRDLSKNIKSSMVGNDVFLTFTNIPEDDFIALLSILKD